MRQHNEHGASPPSGSRTPRWAKRLGDDVTLPIRLAAFPTVGFLFGSFVDRRVGSSPWLTVTCLVLGFVASAREVWVHARREESRKPPP